ncbi:MAG: Rrf2 family transcriptional regulator [Alphaproteobacteria bacterium]
MHLSTRGRYAVMAMLDLAKLQAANTNRPITLAEIAERQDLSLSYLEQLFAKLRRAKLVKSVRGPGGGYVLADAPQHTWLHRIVEAVDEDTDVTRCGAGKDEHGHPKGKGCVHGQLCVTHNLWVALSRHVATFFQQINLAMVLDGTVQHDFVLKPSPNSQPARVRVS